MLLPGAAGAVLMCWVVYFKRPGVHLFVFHQNTLNMFFWVFIQNVFFYQKSSNIFLLIFTKNVFCQKCVLCKTTFWTHTHTQNTCVGTLCVGASECLSICIL